MGYSSSSLASPTTDRALLGVAHITARDTSSSPDTGSVLSSVLPARMPDRENTSELWRLNKQRWQEEYARGATVVESRPAWITLDTGDTCNLHCVHCPRENPGGGFVEHNADQSLVDRLRDSLP